MWSVIVAAAYVSAGFVLGAFVALRYVRWADAFNHQVEDHSFVGAGDLRDATRW